MSAFDLKSTVLVCVLTLSTLGLGLMSCSTQSTAPTSLPAESADGASGSLDAMHQEVGLTKVHSQEHGLEEYVDEHGYLQPVDVKRPRPARQHPPRPSLEQIRRFHDDAERHSTKSADFEVRVGPVDGHTHNETSIDMDGDTLIAGWNEFDDRGSFVMGWGRSADRGVTWTYDQFDSFSTMSDPVVSAAGNGVWYFAYIAASGSDYDVYVHRSTDDGLTWGSPVDASQNGSFDDKPHLDSAGDEVLVAWTDFGFSPAAIHVARSLDGGQTFNTPTRLSFNSPGGNGVSPVIGPDGTYYVFWRSGGWFIWMSKSTDQGQTWPTDVSIANLTPLPNPLPGQSFRIVNLPSAAADPVTGDLVVVWNDQAFGDPDIVSIRSSDNGDTWSALTRVSDDSNGSTQFFPWLTFDEAGTASVVWYDQRQNGSDLDIYLAQSFDQGQTWEPNIRVTDSSFTPILPWESGPANFIGDYNGVAASLGDVFPFYQDARSGVQEVYMAKLSPNSTCSSDAECDDRLYCNGVESCISGSCVAGNDPCPGQICNESTGTCESPQPVTVTFTSIGGEDGWVRESSETSNVGGSSNASGAGARPIRPGDASQDRQFKSILSFDTSSLPDGAIIQSATLRLRRGTVRGSNPFTSGFGSCLVDVMSGGFSGNTALQASDFQATATATSVATLSAPAANGDWSEGSFNGAGLAVINKTGKTQTRVYFTVDDNDDGGDDHMGYYSGDNNSGANHPQLVVTYLP